MSAIPSTAPQMMPMSGASTSADGHEGGGPSHRETDGGHDLLSRIVEIAISAGELLKAGLGDLRDVRTKTSPTDVVTEMDAKSERLIIDAIREIRPSDAFLAEEGGAHRGTSEVTWIIDPLDGTVNYLYRLPPYVVSIAAADTESTFLGVVHDPVHHETFSALRGVGAWLNGAPLRRESHASVKLSLVGTGFSYSAARRSVQAAVASQVIPAVRDIRRAGAAAADLCWVAAGRLDAFYEAGLQPWDRAAGELIASQAGAWVGEVPGQPRCLATAVATAPGLETDFLDLLLRSGADSVPEGD